MLPKEIEESSLAHNGEVRGPVRTRWGPGWLWDSMPVVEPSSEPISAPTPRPPTRPPATKPCEYGENRWRLLRPLFRGRPWPDSVTDWVMSLTPEDIPATLGPAVTVVDRVKFLRVLQRDVRLGWECPRTRYGALQQELYELQQLVAATKKPSTNASELDSGK